MEAAQVKPCIPWNKGKLVGQKAPFKLKDIWTLRARLQMQQRTRELALLDLGIDSKLRACDLVALRERDIYHGDHIVRRATVVQRKTLRPVQFDITPGTQEAVEGECKKPVPAVRRSLLFGPGNHGVDGQARGESWLGQRDDV